MGCCGKKREAQKMQEVACVARRVAPPLPPEPAPVLAPDSEQLFHNSGTANVSVRGPVTGRIYVFPANGETVSVDSRDMPYLSAISRILPGPRVRPKDKYKKSDSASTNMHFFVCFGCKPSLLCRARTE